MTIQKVGFKGLTSITKQVQKNANEKMTASPEIKDGKKKIARALSGLAIAAVAGIGITALLKSKDEKVVENLQDICFNKGIATLKNGENFTGVVKSALKNDSIIKMRYLDGIIQTSEKLSQTGENVTKKYARDAAGKITNIITESSSGIIREFIKTSKGHKITENGVLKKAFSLNQDSFIVADFNKKGAPETAKKIVLKGDKIQLISRKEYKYGENSKLLSIKELENEWNLKDFSSNLKSKTTFGDNQIVKKSFHICANKNIPTEVKTITKGGNLRYGADVSVVNNAIGDPQKTYSNFYDKQGRLLVTEKPVYVSSALSSHEDDYYVRKGRGNHVRLNIEDYRKQGEILYGVIRRYEDGSEDVLKNGFTFGAPEAEIEYRDAKGNIEGFLKSKYGQCKEIIVEALDKDHKPIKTYNGYVPQTEWATYDWN